MDNKSTSTALSRINTAAPARYTDVEVLPPEPEFSQQQQAMIGAFARAVVREQQAPKLSEAELREHWAAAFDEWLAEAPKTGSARPVATVKAYTAAWESLQAFARKQPRHIESLDIRAWVDFLRTRTIDPAVAGGLIRNGRRQPGQVGLSPATINQWIAGISSFFSFVQHYEVRTSEGQVVPLLDGPNPAKSHMVKRPETRRLGQDVAWLDDEQLKAVRGVIRSARTLADLERGVASDSHTIKELRDYALILSYMLTAARNSEIRTWQWKDLRKRGSNMFYDWANKGKDGSDQLPQPCWDAVCDYLRLAGRLDDMQPEDYIFQPIGDSILRLKRADGTPVVDPETWTCNRPISGQEANRLLRNYCRKAGITSAAIHIHSLRHSGVMLYLKGGIPVENVSRIAHHSSLDMTMRYTHTMEGQKNTDWSKAADLLGL